MSKCSGFQGVEAENERQVSVNKNGFEVSVQPNPFAVSSTITYHLSRRAKVECKVFDASGREVRTLVSGTMESGDHHLVWNRTDNEHRKLNAGVYFLRITADGIEDEDQVKLIVL